MADFTNIPDFVVSETKGYKTLVSTFENGTEQRRRKWHSPVHSFKLQFRNRTRDEMESIKAFFVSKEGMFSVFSWENPIDAQEYIVRFKEDSLLVELIAYNIYDIRVEFVEVK